MDKGHHQVTATEHQASPGQFFVSLREHSKCYLCTKPLLNPHEMTFEEQGKKFHTFSYPDLGRASDQLKQISLTALPIRSTTQIWVVTCDISALVPQTSFCGEPPVGSQNVGCFLRLVSCVRLYSEFLLQWCDHQNML